MPFHKEYYPILKLKQGEITALKRLKLKNGRAVNPIIDAWPVEMKSARAIAAGYCALITAKMHQLLPINGLGQIFVDPYVAIEKAPHEPPGDVCDALFHVTHKVKKVTRGTAPVYRLNTPSTAYASMDKAAIREKRALIRLQLADANDPNLTTFVSDILRRLSGHCKVGLIIDAERRVGTPVSAYAVAYEAAFRKVIALYAWNELVIASGSMPPNLPTLSKPGGQYPRLDFSFLEEMEKILKQPVALGDYGTVSPEFADLAFDNPAIAAKIKYLVGKNEWFIAREGVTNRLGGSLAEYVKCANTIKGKSTFFAGKGYSWAEDRILEAANKAEAGQHVTWVSVGWVRHITRTADDVAKLP